MPSWIIEAMGDNYLRLGLNKMSSNAGTFAAIFGCHPEECPETYTLFSPIAHVHLGCPPTLLIHGGQDAIVPVKTSRALYERLVAVNVPTVMHILPQTDHAFDLQLPIISPSAHNAIYDIERFIALQNAIVKEAGVAARRIEEVRHRV
jgi:acetyl esterase/lipase